MKLSRVLSTLGFLVLVAPAFAHPGHEGDHGLTWDLGHMAAHPVATVLWAGLFATAVWGAVRLGARSRVAVRSETRRD